MDYNEIVNNIELDSAYKYIKDYIYETEKIHMDDATFNDLVNQEFVLMEPSFEFKNRTDLQIAVPAQISVDIPGYKVIKTIWIDWEKTGRVVKFVYKYYSVRHLNDYFLSHLRLEKLREEAFKLEAYEQYIALNCRSIFSDHIEIIIYK